MVKEQNYLCFKYVVTVTLNQETIKNDSQKISKTKPVQVKINRKKIFFSYMIKWIEKKLKQTTKQLFLAFCFKSK